MIENLLGLFHYQFFINAFFAALLASISCGIIGTYIVSKRLVFISGGITHASFGGIGIGYYLGFSPILGAAVFGVLSALGLEFLSRKSTIREDSAIGIMWSFGMAIGIIFVFISPGYAPNLMSYLFGSILTVSVSDIVLMSVLTLVLVLFFSLFYRNILYISFDEEYARAHQVPVHLYKYLLMILLALTIVLNIRVVGIILVISLLTIPQTTANLFTKSFHSIIYLSILMGFIGSFGGLLLSYAINIPSGAAIIFSLVLLFLLARMLRYALSWMSLRNVKRQLPNN